MLLPLVLINVATASVLANKFAFFDQTSQKSPLNFISEPFDTGSFSPPFSSLSNLSDSDWTILSHPLYPKHSVRVRKSNLCNDTANGYSGYIDIGARHLFFYFFESRNDPATDDVIFWTNGGPGGSSAVGLFFELGPCRITDESGPKFHPESWNTNANIFFIDQPIGTGFSYAEFGETVFSTEEAAVDVAAFVSIFFDNFEQLKGRRFHMAGESYAGRFLPLFASEVYDHNAVRLQAGLPAINLTSVIIGNGMMDSYKTMLSYYDIQCTPASIAPFLNISACVNMKNMVNRCERWMKKACFDHFDFIDCSTVFANCHNAILVPFYDTGRNPFEVNKPCDGVWTESLCYPQTRHIQNFLNNQTNRATLGVDKTFTKPWISFNLQINAQFDSIGDILHTSTNHISALLERNIPILIFVGVHDLICNHVGTERWALGMEWSGKAAFGSAEMREWFVDGKRAGLTRSARGLTYATIDDAGHMVPYNKPKEALAMIQRWLARDDL